MTKKEAKRILSHYALPCNIEELIVYVDDYCLLYRQFKFSVFKNIVETISDGNYTAKLGIQYYSVRYCVSIVEAPYYPEYWS